MPQIHPGILQQLELIDPSDADSWPARTQQLRLYVWFHELLYNEVLDLGGEEKAYTFRQMDDYVLLVYKASFDGIQQVVFTSGPTPSHCMRSLCKRFYAGTLAWKKDKYA